MNVFLKSFRLLCLVLTQVAFFNSSILAQQCPADAPNGYVVEESGGNCYILFTWPSNQMPELACGTPGTPAAGSTSFTGKLIDLTLNAVTTIYANGNNCNGSTFNFAYHSTIPDTYISTTSHCDIALLPAVQFDANRTGGSNFSCVQQNNSPSALPVELLGFSAEIRKGGEILLEWRTAWEENNKHFIVERSLDGKNFSKISTITGLGTSSQLGRYNYVDRNAAGGVNYYRLKQVDYDGVFSYSETVSVQLNVADQWKLYPTVVSSQVNLEYLSNSSVQTTVSVTDLYGRVVWQREMDMNNEKRALDLADLSKGMYVINIQANNNKSTSFKIIKT